MTLNVVLAAALAALHTVGTAPLQCGSGAADRGLGMMAIDARESRAAASGPSPDHRVITVAAASSLRDAATEIARQYEGLNAGATVRLAFGASNQLARQIIEGAPVDLFLSADTRSMDAVERAGRLVPGTKIDLLSNALVVVVPADSTPTIHAAGDLAAPGVLRIALCDDAVPLGHYARVWLTYKGVLPTIEQRAVRPSDARAALAMVESGAVDAGLIYATDAKLSRRVKIALEIPLSETPGIVYPVALVADGPNPRGGKRFLEFLESPCAASVFSTAGFGLIRRP